MDKNELLKIAKELLAAELAKTGAPIKAVPASTQKLVPVKRSFRQSFKKADVTVRPDAGFGSVTVIKKEITKKEDIMDKKTAIEMAKSLLKSAKEDPKKFQEELKKAMGAPAAPAMPAPKTSPTPTAKMPMPKAPMPPKQPVQAPGLNKAPTASAAPAGTSAAPAAPKKFGQMSKEEIAADLKKEWQPKFHKAVTC